jgi:putative FmdB family regulatory protein
MPLYEYKCERCGDVFEVMQKFSDAPLDVHEGCGGHVERLLSAPALQFKGTGWYITDYARNSGNGKPAGKSESKEGGSTETKKTDTSKPASTPSTSSDKK